MVRQWLPRHRYSRERSSGRGPRHRRPAWTTCVAAGPSTLLVPHAWNQEQAWYEEAMEHPNEHVHCAVQACCARMVHATVVDHYRSRRGVKARRYTDSAVRPNAQVHLPPTTNTTDQEICTKLRKTAMFIAAASGQMQRVVGQHTLLTISTDFTMPYPFAPSLLQAPSASVWHDRLLAPSTTHSRCSCSPFLG